MKKHKCSVECCRTENSTIHTPLYALLNVFARNFQIYQYTYVNTMAGHCVLTRSIKFDVRTSHVSIAMEFLNENDVVLHYELHCDGRGGGLCLSF